MKRAAPRVYNPSSLSAAHLNQKPLQFMQRILSAATDPGDIVWEPFGGLASASVAAVETGRFPSLQKWITSSQRSLLNALKMPAQDGTQKETDRTSRPLGRLK